MMGAPLQLYTLLHFIAVASPQEQKGSLHLVEYFCGVAAHTRAFQACGLNVVGFDILRDGLFMDIASKLGVVTALTLCTRVMPGGVGWLATVCSSFSWMCRHSVERSKTAPLGDACSWSATNGNLLAARSALIMLLLMALGAGWFLEQPANSIMASHPSLEYVKELASKLPKLCEWHAADSFLGAFGAQSLKPVTIRSNKQWVWSLATSRPSLASFDSSDITEVTDSGLDMMTGKRKQAIAGKKGLKQTEQYPDAFGHAFMDAYICMQLESEPIDEVDIDEDYMEMPVSHAAWEDLGMDSTLQMAVSELQSLQRR